MITLKTKILRRKINELIQFLSSNSIEDCTAIMKLLNKWITETTINDSLKFTPRQLKSNLERGKG